MHIFNAGGSARWGPVPFMKKTVGDFGFPAVFFTTATSVENFFRETVEKNTPVPI